MVPVRHCSGTRCSGSFYGVQSGWRVGCRRRNPHQSRFSSTRHRDTHPGNLCVAVPAYRNLNTSFFILPVFVVLLLCPFSAGPFGAAALRKFGGRQCRKVCCSFSIYLFVGLAVSKRRDSGAVPAGAPFGCRTDRREARLMFYEQSDFPLFCCGCLVTPSAVGRPGQ